MSGHKAYQPAENKTDLSHLVFFTVDHNANWSKTSLCERD